MVTVLRALCPLVASLALMSCFNREVGRSVQPPPTHPLVRGLGYAVITDSYIQVMDIPGTTGVVTGYCRKGDIVQVTERRSVQADGVSELWLGSPQKGWIRESEVELYVNEQQAKTAARQLPR